MVVQVKIFKKNRNQAIELHQVAQKDESTEQWLQR